MADAISSLPSAESAAADAAERLASTLSARGASVTPDLLLAFVTPHHARSLAEIERTLSARLAPRHVVAVASEGVISAGIEVESGSAIALLGMVLPHATITTFSSEHLPMSVGIEPDDLRALSANPASTAVDPVMHAIESDLAGLARAVGIVPGHRATLLMADPFTTPINPLLATLSRARNTLNASGGEDRRGVIAGGLVSASARPGGNTILVDGQLLSSGFVGCSIASPAGHLTADSVVSQGCKPIGDNLIVTSARGQFIRTLGGRPALDVLHELIESASEPLRRQIATGLMIGRVVNEYKDHFGRSDYLIRNIVGVMKQDKAIAVADNVRVGQTVRFHVRDAQTASEDLAMLMDAQALHDRPLGAVLFSCNGRGSRLFPPNQPNHDAAAIQHAFAPPMPGETRAKAGSPHQLTPTIPLAGFFAAGEIGPVGDQVFLHGQTASAVIFRGT
jgi:small ligand-binding sensory domain FIST